jgi:peptide/nickel transport system ATP-binding protein
MRQRAMIAMSLACDPRVLVADEPTTALDVSVQAEILRLIRDLQARMKTGVVLITHDFGVVAEVADHVLVMYGGRQVESAPVEAIFDEPLHPYTRLLLAAAPRVSQDGDALARLNEIPGTVPRVDGFPPGCPFATRCPAVVDRCWTERPPLEAKRPGHLAACWVVA